MRSVEDPFHHWPTPPLGISVDGFDPAYVYKGVFRGPSPTVAIRTSGGTVLATRRVYPNAALGYRKLTVHASAYGLAPSFSLVNPAGEVVARDQPLVDFSDETSSGVAPLEFALGAESNPNAVDVSVLVPLDRVASQLQQRVPRRPTVDVRLVSPRDGSTISSGRLTEGESISLPEGSSLRFDSLGYYARVSVVDDWTIGLLYALFGIALTSMSAALLVRQRVIFVWATRAGRGVELHVVCRLWRNAEVTSAEVRGAIEAASVPGEGASNT